MALMAFGPPVDTPMAITLRTESHKDCRLG
jgi:hypothetical protein